MSGIRFCRPDLKQPAQYYQSAPDHLAGRQRFPGKDRGGYSPENHFGHQQNTQPCRIKPKSGPHQAGNRQPPPQPAGGEDRDPDTGGISGGDCGQRFKERGRRRRRSASRQRQTRTPQAAAELGTSGAFQRWCPPRSAPRRRPSIRPNCAEPAQRLHPLA